MNRQSRSNEMKLTNRLLGGLFLAMSLLVLTLCAACGDGDGPAWAGGEKDTTSGSTSKPTQNTHSNSFGSMTLEEVWGEGMEIAIDDYTWTQNGEMQFRMTLIDPVSGEAVENLTSNSFSFAENGQDLGSEALYEVERAKDLRVVLVLDVSESVRSAHALESLKNSVKALFNALPRSAYISVIGFASNHELLADFTADAAQINKIIDALEPPEGVNGRFTNLYGALERAAGLFGDFEGARRVVIFSDGRDNVAESTLEDASNALKAAHISTFAVGLGEDVDVSALSHIAGDGQLTTTLDPNALEPMFTSVAARLSELWTLTYTTPKRRGSHTLEVTAGDDTQNAGFRVRFTLD